MNNLELLAVISGRLRAYQRQLGFVRQDDSVARLAQTAANLDEALASLRKLLANPKSQDFLDYRLAAFFHARERDFKNPRIIRQPLVPASFSRPSQHAEE